MPVNNTFIVLIPKLIDLNSTKDYRHISLCNALIKLISKTMTNQLKMVLPYLIGEYQSAFVINSAIIAYETLYSLRNKRTSRVGQITLKIDMAKAYDCLEWDFVDAIFRSMGFGDRWIRLIMDSIFRSMGFKSATFLLMLTVCLYC